MLIQKNLLMPLSSDTENSSVWHSKKKIKSLQTDEYFLLGNDPKNPPGQEVSFVLKRIQTIRTSR